MPAASIPDSMAGWSYLVIRGRDCGFDLDRIAFRTTPPELVDYVMASKCRLPAELAPQ